MVRLFALTLIGLAVVGRAAVGAGDAPDADPSRAVGRAMAKGAFPWYDAPKDEVRPIQVPDGLGWWSSNGTSGSASTSSPSAPSGGWDIGRGVSLAVFSL